MSPRTNDDAGFAQIFERTSRRVYAYARRHSDATTAEEVVSETYLAAWRRRDSLPEDALPWLLVTARNLLRNHWRSRDRQLRLTAELAGIEQLAAVPGADGVVVDRDGMLRALSTLRPTERETLLLVAWDQLDRTAAAAVAGCSERTFAVRLHRARQALDRALKADTPVDPGSRRTAPSGIGSPASQLPIQPSLKESP